MSESRVHWRSVAVVALSALATFALADVAIQRVRPLFPPVRHVDEGVADLAAHAPTVLVLGSSHARSFDAVGEALAARTSGRERIVTVPVELGGFTSYLWVLENRLGELLRPETMRRDLPNLREIYLITTFYDACSEEYTNRSLNLPARGWTLSFYLQNLRDEGLNDKGRVYLREQLKRLLPFSILIQDRGAWNIAGALKRLLKPEPPDEALESARATLEAQDAHCHDERELAALGRIADWATARGLALTVIAFPLVPEIVSDVARRTTLARYSATGEAMARRHSFRFLDLTLSSPMTRADFAADFDHVTHDGNRKLAEWLLAHDLRALVERAAGGVP